MQHNNKNNLNIANKLNLISEQIKNLDNSNISLSIAEIHKANQEIELIAKNYELSTLLAVIHCIDLSTELNQNNFDKIEVLLANHSFSNYLDVFVSILRSYDDSQRPLLHQSLTSPNWVVKPSTILLKNIAVWIARIKKESDDSKALETKVINDFDNIASDNISSSGGITTNNIIEDKVELDEIIEVSTDDSNQIDNLTNEQLIQAEETDKESLIDQDAFKETDLDIIGKDYLQTEESKNITDQKSLNIDSESVDIESVEIESENIESENIESVDIESVDIEANIKNEDFQLFDDVTTNSSFENLDSSNVNEYIDDNTKVSDELFSENNALVESLLNNDKTDSTEVNENISDELASNETVTTETSFHDINFELELKDIHNSLNSISIPNNNVFSVRSSFTKHLDRLALMTEDTNLQSVIPVVDWCQRNLALFEENTTSKIEKFVSTGKVWSWLEQLSDCINEPDKNKCLSSLTNHLTHKEWLEPLASDELEALLLSLKTELDDQDKQLESELIDESNQVAPVINEIVSKENLPEIIDSLTSSAGAETTSEPETIINKSDDAEHIKETSGLKMTWDDDTHPELLMVYLEETPNQVEELIPLLIKINKDKSNNEDRVIAARLAHTIKGGSAVVGITALADLTSHLEIILEHSIDSKLKSDILEKLPKVGECITSTFDNVQLQLEEPEEFLHIFTLLKTYSSEIESGQAESEKYPAVVSELESTTEQESEIIEETEDSEVTSIDAKTIDEQEVVSVEREATHSEKSNFKLTWDDDTHPELLMVYLEETPTQITQLVPLLNKISLNDADADEKHVASRMAHTIKGGSAIVGITALSEISYRLESLLDHSVKHQLPKEILEVLPQTANCIENLFEAIQMQDEEPSEYYSIFKQLDEYVDSIDSEDNDDEPLELPTLALPDFILNQNKEPSTQFDESANESQVIDTIEADTIKVNTDIESELNDIEDQTHELEADTDVFLDDVTEISDIGEVEINEAKIESNEDDSLIFDLETVDSNDVDADIDEVETDKAQTEEITTELEAETVTEIESTEIEEEASIAVAEIQEENSQIVANDTVKLEKLKSREDVNNIITELDDIVFNLIGNSSISDDTTTYVEKCSVELQRFELITDITGYPELTLLGQWCQSNLNKYAETSDENFNSFIQSNEIWSWIEHVGEALRESEDMAHMSSLSVELMREDWLQAIEMEDLQTVLLALRHLEDSALLDTNEYIIESNDSDEVISWDKDVHPELLAVYFKETPDQIDRVASLLHKISKGESTIDENKEAARIAHTIKGSSGVVGLNSLLELTHHLEDILDYSVNNNISQETADLLSEASDCMEGLFETIQDKQAPPEDLNSVIARLSTFSGQLDQSENNTKVADLAKNISESIELDDNIIESTSDDNMFKPLIDRASVPKVDLNEAYIRVPIKVIDQLLNLAGELVTTSSQVSDNLTKTQETNKAIRVQDERVHNMLLELNNTIIKQEKDQQVLLSSIDNSDFDSLEMDTYNELQSVASLLSESILDSQEIDSTLSNQLNDLSEKLHSLDKLNKTFSDVILSSRMVTIDTMVPRLERIVRQTCRKTNKKAQLVVTGNNINIDTDILNNLVDPLLHMLRNSIDHGIETPELRKSKGKDETGLIELSFSRDGNNIIMSLKDDGAGINPEKIYQKAIEKELITPDQEFSDSDAIKLILQPGFTTQDTVTDISGRGVGMDVVNSSIQDLKGTMDIDSTLEKGTTFNLSIPLTLITNTTLLVKVEDSTLAIPTDIIDQILYLEANTLIERDNDFYVIHNGEELKTQSLGHLLSWPHKAIDINKSYNVLIIKSNNKFHAIHIDSIVSSREVVVKSLNPWVSSARGVVGACHLTDGGVAPVINLQTVVRYSLENASQIMMTTALKPEVKKKILVVDDSLSNRKALSLIIEKTEYDVISAVDGLDALQKMNKNNIDLVFTDLEMPRMNGLELTQSIRAWNDKKETPIVMITSRTTNKHRELATKAGVDDYLTKPVETGTLLNSIATWLTSKKSEAVEV